MKIGFVHRGFSSTGGAEGFLKRFAAEAKRLGHACVLFTAEWPRDEWPYGELVTINKRSQLEFANALLQLDTRQYCDVVFALDRIWACDCYRASGGVHAIWLQRQGMNESSWRTWFRRRQRKNREVLLLERRLFSANGAKRIVTNSKRVKQEIINTYHYPAEQIRVIYNGISEQHYDPSARARLRQQLGFGMDDYVAIFVGNGWERKGLAMAIEAMNQLADESCHLVVLGRGKRRKLPHSTRVYFAGAVRPVNDWLVMADTFVLPTLYEPFSNACLEAASAGLPVITSAANGFAEIITDGEEGSIVQDPKDITAIATALAFWRPVERRAVARERMLALAKHYSIERNVKETLAWFEQR